MHSAIPAEFRTTDRGTDQPSRRAPDEARVTEPVALAIDRRSGPFRAALSQWQSLARSAPPLLAPELSLLSARLAGEADAVLAGARRGGSLVAALPLARRGRSLHALRSDHTPRVDLVGETAALPQLWRAVRELGDWDTIELRGVPADSPLATVLPDVARADGCAACVREIGRSPWFEVAGIERRIHRRFRGDMRRLERQLGGVELERVATYDRRAMRDVIRLEASGWKGETRTAIACDPRLASYYAVAARVFARRGQLTLAFLRARGKRVAACFALEDGATFYLLKIGYDPEYAHFGPGQLLVRETALDAERRGIARYDLLGKDAPYKMKWTDRVRVHVAVTIYAPTWRGHATRWVREVARPFAARASRFARRGNRARA